MSQTKAQLLDGKSATIQFTGGSASAPSVSFTGDTNTGIYSPGADQVAISTSGSGRLFVDASGRVGVNTANPLQQFHVNGNAVVGGSPAARYSSFTVAGDSAIQAGAPLLNFVNAAGSTRFGYVYHNGTGGNFDILNQENGGLTLGTNNQERLRITSAGLVGVGTSSPSYPFHVANGALGITSFSNSIDGASEVGLLLRGQNGSHNTSLLFSSSNTNVRTRQYFNVADGSLRWDTSSDGTTFNSRLYLSTAGNVGIGTTSPNAPLCVNGLPPQAGIISAVAASNGRSLALSDNINCSLYVTHLAGGALIGTDSGNAIRFATNGFGSSDEKARIDSSGRLLVGTSASVWGGGIESMRTTGLQYVGGRFSADNFPAEITVLKSRGASVGTNTIVQNNDVLGNINFLGADGTTYLTAVQISAQVDGTPGTNDMPSRLVFAVTADGASSPTERMRITQNGFTKHSNTGAYLSTTAAYHEFRSDAGSGALTLNVSNSNATGNGLQSGLNSDGTAYAHFIGYSTSAAANRIIIWSNGNVVNTNNSYGAISDIKLKENIVDAGSQWSDIKALQVRKYNFKEGQTHTQIGLIAQEVELVSPGLVSESPDRDEDGNDLGTVTKSVNYSVLYMKAVKALQEAMERIEQLEAEMVAVKAQLS